MRSEQWFESVPVLQIPSHERANLWVVCAAQFTCLAGMTAVLPLLPLYLEQIGVGDRDSIRYWSGALSAAPFVAAMFMTPLWGALGDRVGHKPMVIRSVLGIAVATVGMGFSREAIELLGWRGLQGAVSGIFPAAVGLITSLTPHARVGRSLAILQANRAAGSLCGPLIGGVLADVVGIEALFFGVGAIAVVMSVLCIAVLDEPRENASTDSMGPPPRWRGLFGQRPVLTMLGVIVVYQSAIMASWPTMALFVEEFGVEHGAVATMTGVVIFAQGLPSMLLATTWVRLVPRFGMTRVLFFSIVLSGMTLFAVGLAPDIETVIALRLLSGVAMAGFIPLSFQWLNGHAPENARGRMAGVSSTAMMQGNLVGSACGAWLSVELSLAATFWVPGILLTVTGLLFAVASRARD